MKKTPKISVIIPIYNVEKYLSRCLNSVIGQTFEDFEIICVNDGSPDKCLTILQEFAKKDKRIKITTQKNLGLSMARNNGLKEARGEYIFFLDSDDCIHPRLLEVAFKFAHKYNADVVTFNYAKHKDKYTNSQLDMPTCHPIKNMDKIAHKFTNEPLKYCKSSGSYTINFNAWTKFYKRDILNGTKFIKNICFEDYPHTLSILLKKPATVILKQDLYYYTENPSSISNESLKIKHIKDYHSGLNAVYKMFSRGDKKEFNFMVKEIVPKILKHQLNRIKRSPKEIQPDLYQAFSKELADLDQKGCIRFRNNKLCRYLIYKRLINGALND